MLSLLLLIIGFTYGSNRFLKALHTLAFTASKWYCKGVSTQGNGNVLYVIINTANFQLISLQTYIIYKYLF